MSFYKKLLSLSNFSIILFLFLLTFITYANILPNQLFYDDEELIYKNAYVKDLRFFPKYFTENMIAGAGKKSNMYRPILLASFALDHIIWKDSQIGYHLTSIFLHAVNAVLIFFLIWKLFKDKLLSFLTSLFFIVHPVNSEAVIYASGRTDPLYSFFFLISIFFFLRHLEQSSSSYEVAKDKRASSEARKPYNHLGGGKLSLRSYDSPEVKLSVKPQTYYLLSIIFFILALLSKETAIILPGLLLLIYIVHKTKRKPQFARLTFYIAPFLLIDIIYILLRLTVLNFSNTLNFYQTPTLYSQNLLIRLYTFAHVFFQYLGVLVFPADLIFARQIDLIFSPLNTWVILFIIIITALLTFSIVKWQKNKLFLFAFLWFFITILPVSGLVPINSIAAEHYLYLPSISFFLIVSYFFVSLWKKYQNSSTPGEPLPPSLKLRWTSRVTPGVSRISKYLPYRIYRIILISFLTIICLTFFIRTIIRTFDWRDPITFYTKSIQQSPDHIPLRHNLAMAYAEKGNYELAIKEYQNLITLADVYPNTHHNLANALKEIGKYKEAEEEYMKALKMDPNFHFSLYGLVDLYQKMGEKEKLEKIIKRIEKIEITPPNPLLK